MFSGPDGISIQPHYCASAHLDRSIYKRGSKVTESMLKVDVDNLRGGDSK